MPVIKAKINYQTTSLRNRCNVVWIANKLLEVYFGTICLWTLFNQSADDDVMKLLEADFENCPSIFLLPLRSIVTIYGFKKVDA